MRRRARGPEFPKWMTSPLASDYLTGAESAEPWWQITAWQRHLERVEAWRKVHRVAQEDVPVEVPRLAAT